MHTPLKNVYYINLLHRTDRKEKIEYQLNELKWDYQRYNAVKLPKSPSSSRIGCSLSHLSILKEAHEKKLDYVVILEDDIKFVDTQSFNNRLESVLNDNTNFDVLLICTNAKKPLVQISKYLAKAYDCQTTTGYIVKNHYFETLIQNYTEGIQLLMKNPQHYYYYSIDMYWKKLQKKDNWYLIIPMEVYQEDGYSDIEKVHKNYYKIKKVLIYPLASNNSSEPDK